MSASLDPFEIFYLRRTLWSVVRDYRRLLFDQAGLRLSEWLQGGTAQVVKKGAGRAIYHVRHPDGEFYIKHFRPTARLRSLHQRFRRDRAVKEFDVARQMRSQGIPTVRPLALGEKRKLGLLSESFLVTEASANHQTLFELVEEHHRRPESMTNVERRCLARDLADLTASLHARGLEHRDLHERNIVVERVRSSLDGTRSFDLRILDLHELRRHRELTWAQTLHELARLGRYFSIRTGRTDRVRFLKRYGEVCGWTREEFRIRARAIEEEVIQSRANFWRRRDLRPTWRSSLVQKDRGSGAIWHRSLPTLEARDFVARPAGWLAERVLVWWKRGRSTQVAEARIDNESRPLLPIASIVIVKRYLYHPFRELIASLLRDNPATRAWRNGWALRIRELPTPQPLLLVHRRRWGLVTESYLMTERVGDGKPIDRYLSDACERMSKSERPRFIRSYVEQAGRLLRRMHERGITHPDLKATNVLAVTSQRGDRPEFWLIDLDGVKTWQRVPDREMVQNLARFAVGFRHHPWLTRTDRVRFLRAYLGGFRFNGVWKPLWRELAAWGEKKVERNRRRGRFLA
jgi:tRNA A-37 threonylcarbamoyl transferase component Bud32